MPIHFGGQIQFPEHNSKCFRAKCFRAINLKLGTDAWPGLGEMSIHLGVAILNFGVPECKKVNNHFWWYISITIIVIKLKLGTQTHLKSSKTSFEFSVSICGFPCSYFSLLSEAMGILCPSLGCYFKSSHEELFSRNHKYSIWQGRIHLVHIWNINFPSLCIYSEIAKSHFCSNISKFSHKMVNGRKQALWSMLIFWYIETHVDFMFF